LRRSNEPPTDDQAGAVSPPGRGRPSVFPAMRMLIWGVALATLGVIAHRFVDKHEQIFTPDQVVEVEDFEELSGIAFRPATNTLFGVSDAGRIGELTLAGKLLRHRDYPKCDLEDITLTEDGQEAWVIDESNRNVLRFRLSDFEIIEERSVAGLVGTGRKSNVGFEGLARGPAQAEWTFSLETEPSAMVTCPIGLKSPANIEILDVPSVSSVIVSPDGDRLLVSRESGIMLADAAGNPFGPWRDVDAYFMEGATLVPGKGLFLCMDRKPGQLLIIRSLDSWKAIHDKLSQPD